MSQEKKSNFGKGLMIALFAFIPLSILIAVIGFCTMESQTVPIIFSVIPFVIIGAFVVYWNIFTFRAAKRSFRAGFTPSGNDDPLMRQMQEDAMRMHRQANEDAMRIHQQAHEMHQQMHEDAVQMQQQFDQMINQPPMGF